MNNSSAYLITGILLSSLVFVGEGWAWVPGGTGGDVNIGGAITPSSPKNPWEVLVGSAVTDLNAPIKMGVSNVVIPINKAITVLGIRTQTNQPFTGGVGMSPQIDFKGAYNTTQQPFESSTGLLSMNVLDVKDGSVIGHLAVPMFSGAISSWLAGVDSAQNELYASQSGQGFFGGIASSASAVSPNIVTTLNTINPEFSANYNTQSAGVLNVPVTETYTAVTTTFSAYYGAGIQVGQIMNLVLNTPAASNAITWKASLPITVSYQ
ncbi:F4 family fimbrial subunit [Citrobacter braakii]|uniref:F4 family fimbrial subunit n=1 Tax=Citrobacter braakii TaxID=57706 RepID=UPI0019058561|nr:hypothetical protein [Citrobacter braakii]MBJ9048887.1 hypothetical protein [Citrobacter braakii]